MTLNRSRWAAVGAAVAVTLGAGGIGLVKAAEANAESVFVPITNCRIFDTRSASDAGPFDEPIGEEQEITVMGHGDTGDCSGIPTTATALQLNVTAVNATEDTYLTIYPADAAELPFTSSMNPRAGEGPAYNAVVTGLSADGEFNVYNEFGSIDVLADVSGYYVPASALTGPAPALSTTDGDDVTTINDDTVVVDASISTEGAGYVQATAVGTASGAAPDTLWCSLSGTATFDDGSTQKVSLVAGTLGSISTMRTFEVTEATEDFMVNLVCKTEGVTAATVANPQITLTYIPAEIAPAT